MWLEGFPMSRLTRALGFGGGDKRARPSTDSPKVRRIRETMRWRGYDLSEYTDEQIATVSARFPNDISEDGETTEDGRRALAAALEQGDFAPAPEPPPAAPAPEPEPEQAAAEVPPAAAGPTPRQEPPRPQTAPASGHRATLGMPTLPERFAHIFGIHAWRLLDGDGKRMQCVGCGQMRNEPIPFRPPSPPPPPPPPPPREDPISRREPPPSPLDDLPNLGDRDRDRERDPMGRPGQRPQRPPGQQRSDSAWDFFMGLPWWSKLLAIFIAIQVILFIVSAVAGGGGGG